MMTVPLFTHNFTYLLIITRHNTYLQIPQEAVKGQQWEWANKPKRKNNLIKKTKTMRDKKNMDKKEKMLCWDLNLLCYQPPAHEVSSLTTGLIALLNLLYYFNTFLCQRHCLKMVELYLSWMHAKIHFKEN